MLHAFKIGVAMVEHGGVIPNLEFSTTLSPLETVLPEAAWAVGDTTG
jgi:hypothetical protein